MVGPALPQDRSPRYQTVGVYERVRSLEGIIVPIQAAKE